jgi:hypothetical protein
MPEELGREFLARIEAAKTQLRGITEEQAGQRYREGGWTRKQLLGHLLDSAANNEQRFVRAALYSQFECPGYEQEPWVAIHGYDEMSWAALLTAWLSRNAMLAEIVRRIDAGRLGAPISIGGKPAVTLEWVIRDYCRHLDHHVAQITSAL